MGPHVSVQAPPNLSDADQQLRLLDAGISDWGGVSPLTPDHVNPERPWPAIEALAATTASRGKTPPRATHDLSAVRGEAPIRTWRGRCVRRSRRCSATTASRSRDRSPEPVALAGPRRHVEAADDRSHVREGVRGRPPRGRRRRLRGDPRGGRRHPRHGPLETSCPSASAPRSGRPCGRPSGTARSPTTRRLALFQAEGADLDALRRVADGLRAGGRRRRRHLRDQPEHQLHERLLRGVPLLRVRAAGGRSGGVHAHARRRWPTERRRRGRDGASEVCMQGGIHPDLPGSFYLDLLDAVKAPGPGDPRPRLQSRWRS